MMAMRELQQLAESITIKATPDQVVFEDARGQRSTRSTARTPRSRWREPTSARNRGGTRPSSSRNSRPPSSKLIQTWDVDENGRLVLVAKVESLKLVTPDQKAVFDKKPGLNLKRRRYGAPAPCSARAAARRAG